MLLDKFLSVAGASGPQPDAQFNYVTMLLHGDGTNGAQNNTFVDSSSNNFTITRNGNTTQGSFSPYGTNWSNYFPSGSYLNTSSSGAFSFGTSDFCLEAWVNLDSLSSIQSIFSTVDSGITGGYSLIVLASGYVEVDVVPAQSIIANSNPVTAGKWTHIAFTKSSGTYRLFVNGFLCTTSTNTLGSTINAGTNLCIGKSVASGYAFPLSGYISNARIVQGSAIYTSAFTPSTAPLTNVTGTSILTCQSNNFRDNSSNYFALTVNGSPSVQRFNPFGASTAYDKTVLGGSGYFNVNTVDYLTVADNAAFELGSGNFTMEAWIYPNDAGFQTICAKETYSGVGEFEFYLYNGYINAYASAGSSWNVGLASGQIVPQKAWSHIAFTRNGSAWNIWFNGVSVASTTASFTINNNAQALGIGAFPDNSYAMNGYMSDFRLVKGTAVYTSTFTPPTAPITAVSGTSVLCNFQNAAIYDNAEMNDMQTVGNAQISTSVKKYGTGAIWCNGQGNEVVCTTPSAANLSFGTGDFTIECWMNTGSTSGQNMLWSFNWATGSGGWAFFPESYGYSGLVFGDGYGSTIKAAWTWSTNTWYHLAVCRSGTSLRLFVDGTQIGSTFTNSNSINALGNWVKIGSNSETNTVGFTGYIDDLRITKGYARYTTTFTPPTAAFPNTGPN